MKPRTLVLRTAGTNCDAEAIHAFELAGSDASLLHINRLLENPSLLNDFELLALPGGFSYGDDIAAGKILANQIVNHLRDAFNEFISAGKPIIGICNGFQVLVKTGLLPGPVTATPDLDELSRVASPVAGWTQTCTLTNNDSGRFTDTWIRLASLSKKCIWTKDLPPLDLPIAHGEGKFVCASDAIRKSIWSNNQVALVYVNADHAPGKGSTTLYRLKGPGPFIRSGPFITSRDGRASQAMRLNEKTELGAAPYNPNGSMDDIAGVCDATGLVFGLMPHPERYAHPQQHPAWSRQHPLPKECAGLAIFRNAVRHVTESIGAGV